MSNEAKPSIDIDRLECTLGALASQRRLYALVALRRRGTPLSVSTLADEVAVRELETTYDQVPSSTLAEVYNSLYHVHLPKLQDAGVVDYDSETETVELIDDDAPVESIVDAVFQG